MQELGIKKDTYYGDFNDPHLLREVGDWGEITSP
jgi:hypothetical protein